MKKTNPVLAGLAAVALSAALVPAFALAADGATTPDTKSMNVKYEVTAGYEWSVPSDIDFGKDKGVNTTSVVNATADSGATQAVKVTKNVIADGSTLHISMKGTDGAFEIKNGGTTLTYTVAKADGAKDSVASGSEILAVPAGTNQKSQGLTFTLKTGAGTAEVAGKYAGTVTYTAEVK